VEESVGGAGRSSPPFIEAATMALLADPLDFLFAEHFRQRKLCNLLEGMALSGFLDTRLAVGVLDFLQRDLVLHVADEEEDLFPLVRRRCKAGDQIDRVLSKLSAEHVDDHHLASILADGLQHAVSHSRSIAEEPGLSDVMADFARNERRHLALENAVLLPLARRRLAAADLAELSARMACRRGGTGTSQILR